MNIKRIWGLFRDAIGSWSADYAPSMGAALSYYTLFSIAPLLVIVIAVAGFFFGADEVRGTLFAQLSGLMGEEGAQAIEGMMQSANEPKEGLISTILGFIVLAAAATTVFAELQSALDRIWRAPAREQTSGIWSLIRTRLLSFGMILGDRIPADRLARRQRRAFRPWQMVGALVRRVGDARPRFQLRGELRDHHAAVRADLQDHPARGLALA